MFAISKSNILILQILEKSLKILFDTKDISLVKSYVTKQFEKIFQRRVSIQDLTFAKEFRGMRGYKANACVPALELTRRLIKKDPRAVPRMNALYYRCRCIELSKHSFSVNAHRYNVLPIRHMQYTFSFTLRIILLM